MVGLKSLIFSSHLPSFHQRTFFFSCYLGMVSVGHGYRWTWLLIILMDMVTDIHGLLGSWILMSMVTDGYGHRRAWIWLLMTVDMVIDGGHGYLYTFFYIRNRFIKNRGSARQKFKKLQGWIDGDLRKFQIFRKIDMRHFLSKSKRISQ